ncbi:nitroreductase family protein [Verrucomicrobiota bacterium]
MEALKDRRSTRAFDAKPLPLQVLSDLLWAAWGISRPDSGKRTAPSARNWQEIDVYVVLPDGAYIYDAKANTLRGGGERRPAQADRRAGFRGHCAPEPGICGGPFEDEGGGP